MKKVIVALKNILSIVVAVCEIIELFLKKARPQVAPCGLFVFLLKKVII